MKQVVGLVIGLALLGGGTPRLHAGYLIENVPYPAELRGGISAVAFTPAGALVVATRHGEIWIRTDATAPDATPTWRRFARGLDEPMALIADSERRLYVAHRPELLRVTDTDGDGTADTFDALGARWGLSHNYHEFFFGLVRDHAGNFYGAPSLDSTVTRDAAHLAAYPTLPVRGPRNLDHVIEPAGHRSETPWRGWVVRIGPDGSFTPFASGFRQTNGMGLSPDGELFVTDNQGDYKPSTGLLHVAAGDFHGHAASLKWEPGYDPAALTTAQLWQRLKTPAVVFPHGPMGQSPGQPAWDTTDGRFGPYAGQVFVGDYSRLVVRATLENVAGTWQGACFPFLGRNELPGYVTGDRLKSGVTRAAFAPDGSLYLGATAGWGAGEDGLQRVRWDGRAALEVRDWRLTDRGFRLTFTRPLNAASLASPASYRLTRFRYYYHVKYGSPWIDEAPVTVSAVHAAADGRGVELIVDELPPGYIYELSVAALRTPEGEPIANPLGYYTLNRRHDGTGTVGGTTRLPRADESAPGAKQAGLNLATPAALIAAGERIYHTYCVGCHQPDGRGVPGGAANFVDDRSRLAKSDAELLAVIERGNEAKAMPAFGAILGLDQRRAALAYVRATFGK
jgi:cytochrome c5